MMFAKVSLFLLVFVVFVSLGRSFPGHHDDSSEEHHHSGQEHDHGKGKKHAKNGEHQYHHGESPYGAGGNMDMNISPDSPFMKVKNLTEDFYNELFVIASGDNYLSPEIPNNVHVDARALVLLSQTLKNMRLIYPYFYNVTTDYALKGLMVDHKQNIIDLVGSLVAVVKRQNPETSSKFESIRNGLTDSFVMRGKYFKSGASPQEKAEAYEKWLYDPFIRTAALNKLFYRALFKSFKSDKLPYIILHAMERQVIFAKEPEKLEKIYSDVVAKTIEKVCPSHDPRKAAFIFYKNLMDRLSQDASLLITLYNDGVMIPGTMFDKPF